MPDTQTTTLNRPWLVKMLIFFAVLVFFGFYGLYDATIAYPQRGMRHASYLEYQYLDTARQNNMLDRRSVSVPDPVGELRRLDSLDKARATPLDGPRSEWLHALKNAGGLAPQNTTIEEPQARYATLKQEWTSSQGAKAAPKPLSPLDIPVQWVFVIVGLGGGLWMLLLFVSVARRRYGWNAGTQTLALPGGQTLSPADIEDFDKRKWDKFLIFLKIKPSHAALGGRELKLDLYRHTPLEAWVLEMERTAFPDRAEAPEAAPPDEGAPVA